MRRKTLINCIENSIVLGYIGIIIAVSITTNKYISPPSIIIQSDKPSFYEHTHTISVLNDNHGTYSQSRNFHKKLSTKNSYNHF